MTKRLDGSTPRLGSGRAGASKRHRTPLKSGEEGALNKPTIRRLARRGGVKRIGGGVYDTVRAVLRSWLGANIVTATTFAEHARRMVVKLPDVLNALRHHGIKLYGYEERVRRRQRMTRQLPREELEAAQARALQRRQQAAAAEAEQPAEAAGEPLAATAVEPATVRKPAAGEPSSPGPAASSSPVPVTPERALEIQRCLNDYRESLERSANYLFSDPEVPVPTALAAVARQLRSRGSAPPSELEFDTVLGALERQNAIMLLEGAPRTLVFTS